MVIKITGYNVICNLGNDIDEVFANAINGMTSCFEINKELIKGKNVRFGSVNCDLPEIDNKDYDLRGNRILLKGFEKINVQRLIDKYGKDKIAIVTATTNSGVQEFETSHNIKHTQISNPATFIKEHFGLKNFCTSVSTACSSGIKAFSIAFDLLNSGFAEAVIIAGVDEISKVPVFGFDSLEILTDSQTNPFSKKRCGINLGEGAGIFVLEKDTKEGISVLGIGETTDYYHSTTPDPTAVEAINAINISLKKASLTPEQIDYINMHGTGTFANDLMEGTAINKIFGEKTFASSTKPMTGHCLGASASVEIGLCCKLLEVKFSKLFPHIYDNDYDCEIPKIKLVSISDGTHKVENILCTSFGFGGTNAAIVLGGVNA